MKTVGEIVKTKRIEKGLTLEEVESATKIRKKFLEAIESDEYGILPSVAYAKGFVKNYSDYLGLPTRDVLAFFRRQTTEASKSSLLPKSVDATLRHTFFRLTPARFVALLLGGLTVIFISSFVLQYLKIKEPPALTVDSPKAETTTTERRIDVLGKTEADATILVNGVSVLVRQDGKFFDQVSLVTVVNTITVTATSRFGKEIVVQRKVTVTEKAD